MHGSTIKIESRKHDGTLNRRWEENTVLFTDANSLIGMNDETWVTESSGKQWQTNEPALFYFDRRYWFNIIYIMQEEKPYYYCNIGSPFTCGDAVLQYIDYDIDVVVQTNLIFEVVDIEEYEQHKELFDYPLHVQKQIELALQTLKQWIRERKRPFQKEFIQHWYMKYNEMKK